MSSQVYCVARFEAKSGEEAAVFRALQQLEPNSHREDGCIQYTITRAHGSEDDERDTSGFHFAFLEIWADEECFEAHCRREEIAGFFAREVEAESGRIARAQVDIYSDEPFDYDAPQLPE
ncbi:putative quinol monooxygenase [Cobetia sp. L2A1]|uniref:putative quinol monooxygenase n=1 Tax=Cobetia sp. L2A1 TaxID=2686360 RepID=UPI00131D6550|nr:antibiotic biosynthesis monooxygenase [Cobetia sp. L2A1]